MAYFLNCGPVASDLCTLGDYVIEWRLDAEDGEIIFVSGNAGNTDPDIQAFHPLVDEIVVAGTLYAILRYAYINGIKYTAYPEEGALHSPDFIGCLANPPVIVEALSCGVTNYTGDYDYQLVREVNVGEKTRTLKFDLDDTTQYLAWGFETIIIADGIEIRYCTLADPVGEIIDYLITGQGLTEVLNPINYPRQPGYNPLLPIDPIIINNLFVGGIVKYVSDLTSFTYQAGDYLKIKIIGNIYDPETDNTKWTLYLKCLETGVFDTFYDVSSIGTLDGSISNTWSAEDCAYFIEYNTIDQLTKVGGFIDSVFYKYFNFTLGGYNCNPDNGGSTTLNWLMHVSSETTGYGNCTQLTDSMTIIKTAAGITYTFTSTIDYDKAVADINHVINDNTYYSDYLSADPQNLSYYGYYLLQGYTYGTDCTDESIPYYNWLIHLSSVIDYDPINKQTLTFNFPVSAITNDMVGPVDCDTSYLFADGIVDKFNDLIALPDNTTYTASIIKGYIIGSTILKSTPWYITSITAQNYIRIRAILLNNIVDPLINGFCTTDPYSYIAYQTNDIVTFNDISSNEARLSNWQIERSRYFTTGNCTDIDIYDLIYREGTTTTTTTTTSVPGLELTWKVLTNAPVANEYVLSQWNTLFNLPTNGTAFTDIVVIGKMVKLIGGANIILKDNIFNGNCSSGLVSVNDIAGCITTGGNLCFRLSGLTSVSLPAMTTSTGGTFQYIPTLTSASLPNLVTTAGSTFTLCEALTTIDLPNLVTAGSGMFSSCTILSSVNLPKVETIGSVCFRLSGLTSVSLPLTTTIGDQAFRGCTALTSVSLPSCTNLGSSVLDDSVFLDISSQTITLTIPSALMTCNGGSPDGDIQYLNSNNTLTVVQV